jgi:hypothetical protein
MIVAISFLATQEWARVSLPLGLAAPHLAARVLMLAPLPHAICEVLHTSRGWAFVCHKRQSVVMTGDAVNFRHSPIYFRAATKAIFRSPSARFFHAGEDADNESGVIAERRRWRGVILSPAGPVRLPRSLAQARIGPGPIF